MSRAWVTQIQTKADAMAGYGNTSKIRLLRILLSLQSFSFTKAHTTAMDEVSCSCLAPYHSKHLWLEECHRAERVMLSYEDDGMPTGLGCKPIRTSKSNMPQSSED